MKFTKDSENINSMEIDKNNLIGIGSNGNRVYKVKNKYNGNVFRSLLI